MAVQYRVSVEQFLEEQLFPLSDVPADLRSIGLESPKLRRWASEGLRSGDNRKGPRVYLETCRTEMGKVTSREALRRFRLALNNASEMADQQRMTDYVPATR